MENPETDKSGNKFWCNDKGQWHREEGPAIEWHDGDEEWYINGKLHRENGPAIKYINGVKEWWVNDKLHREDGPARERSGDDDYKEWWYDGEFIDDSECGFTQEDFDRYLRGLKIKEYW